MSENSPLYNATMHFIGGTLGGMTGVAASYPLDTIKVCPCSCTLPRSVWHHDAPYSNAGASFHCNRSACKRRP